MTNATLPNTSTLEAELLSLTKAIRKAVDELSVMHTESNRKRNELCLNIAKWVDGHVGLQKFKNPSQACEVLADTCKRKTSTVANWRRYGLTIAEHKLSLECDHRSITYLTNMGGLLEQPNRLKVIQWIRDKKDSSNVVREIRTGRKGMLAGSVSRSRSLERAGRLNKTSLKIEMMGLQTMARKILGRDDLVVVISSESMEELMRVGQFNV